MRQKFTRRAHVNDETGYTALVRQRDKARYALKLFIEQWVAPAKQSEANKLVRELVYTQQQTVSYQTEHEVDERDLDIY